MIHPAGRERHMQAGMHTGGKKTKNWHDWSGGQDHWVTGKVPWENQTLWDENGKPETWTVTGKTHRYRHRQREQSDNQKQGYLNTQSDLSAGLGQTRHVADNNTPLLETPTTTTTVYKTQHKCHCIESASVRPGGLTTNEQAAGSTSSVGRVGLGGAGWLEPRPAWPRREPSSWGRAG